MTITGAIEEVRFRNDENGYSIVVLDNNGEPVICVGTFPPVSEGQFLKLTGDFVMHSKFGKQFKVTGVMTGEPDTLDGIVRYLGSGLIKGIGEKTALAIVDKFKDKTLLVMEHQPDLLSSIRGITKSRAREIGEAFNDIRQMQEAMIFFASHNISVNRSLKIYKRYGGDTLAIIKTNPYLLIEDIDGIGFYTADMIAGDIGIARDSDFRIRAGILHTLKEASEKAGNTFLPYDELMAESSKLLSISLDRIESNIINLELERKIKSVDINGMTGVMLINIFRAEKNCAASLVKLLTEANQIKYDCTAEVEEFQRAESVQFHSSQKAAIDMAINSGVAVITGGPGTGKTTIIKCILSIFKHQNSKFLIMAPTGRAAKRLSESTGEDASTIHRALMIGGNSQTVGEPVTAEVVIVDEVSMVDIFLFTTLLSRLRQGTKLILVGDKDQLPSVGAGNVLADILNSGLVPTAMLTKIYRQMNESLIITNAHSINNGIMPDLTQKSGDFFFDRAKSAEEIADKVVALVSTRLPKYLGIEPYKIQVLCPMKNGLAGSYSLNKLLQTSLNGGNVNSIPFEDGIFKVGDKVMHITNNYFLTWKKAVGYSYEEGEGVFNGDAGIISAIDKNRNEIEVVFEDGRRVQYTPDINNQLILAYAITIHKSQGSEFDAVIVPVTGGSNFMMTRNLLYTAITRAKKLVVLVGDEYNIKRMVDNDYIATRYSALKYFLINSKKSLELLCE